MTFYFSIVYSLPKNVKEEKC